MLAARGGVGGSRAALAARPIDVVCMGRAAVDLYGEQIGGRLEDMRSFAKYLGGSPANTAVGVARLGLRPAMLTRVGDEHNGRFVRERLAAEGVDVTHVTTDPRRLTALECKRVAYAAGTGICLAERLPAKAVPAFKAQFFDAQQHVTGSVDIAGDPSRARVSPAQREDVQGRVHRGSIRPARAPGCLHAAPAPRHDAAQQSRSPAQGHVSTFQ